MIPIAKVIDKLDFQYISDYASAQLEFVIHLFIIIIETFRTPNSNDSIHIRIQIYW